MSYSTENISDRFIRARSLEPRVPYGELYGALNPIPYQQALHRALFDRELPRTAERPLQSFNDLQFPYRISPEANKPCEWTRPTLLTMALKERVVLYDCTQGNASAKIPCEEIVEAFAWNPSGSRLAIAYKAHMYVLDPNNDGMKLVQKEDDATQHVEWKNEDIVGIGTRTCFKMRDLRSRQNLSYIEAREEHFTGFKFASKESELFLTTDTGNVERMDLSTGRRISVTKVATSLLTHFERVPKGYMTASWDGCVRTLGEDLQVKEMLNTGDPIISMALLKDGVITGHEGSIFRKWRAGKKVAEEKVSDNIYQIVANPEKDQFAILTSMGRQGGHLLFYRA